MVHVLLLSSFLISLVKIRNSRGKSIELFLGFLVLFIFAALRYEYGNDFIPYQKIFIDSKNNINSANIEWLYFQINRLFPTFQLLIAFLSFFYLYVVYKLIIDNVERKYRWVSMFILIINPYLFLMSLSSLRQTLVLCIFILALKIDFKNKITSFILYTSLIAVGYFIHQTAILLIPFFFICNMKKRPKLDVIIFVLVPLVTILSHNILMYLIEKVLLLFTNNLNYLEYINSNTPGSLRAMLLFLIFYVYVLINLHKLNGKEYVYTKLYLIGLMFALLSFRFGMFGRFQMYFDVFGVVALPIVFKNAKKSSKRSIDYTVNAVVFPIVICAIFVLRYYSFFTTELWSYFFEYKTFLSK